MIVDDFGREILWCPKHASVLLLIVGQLLRQPEIRQHHVAILIYEHVLRLEIFTRMGEKGCVSMRERW